MSNAYDRRTLIAYRLERAHESLQDARLLARQDGSPASIINRAYYAMFYTVLALLIERGLSTSKHSGAIALFDRHFVRDGIFPKNMSRSLHRAFDMRQIGDYREMFFPTAEQALQVLQDAEAFVHEVEAYLGNSPQK